MIVRRLGYLSYENGIIYLSLGNVKIIVLPQTLVPKVIKEAHGTLLTGHGSKDKTLQSLPPGKCNALLMGDPAIAFDPKVYEYLWDDDRPPLDKTETDIFQPYIK